mmetsp:Transcript_25787/g.54519  ORF Transcript_25787/g.54519 Transcript_25787/m.54519 type:complete len:384 (+) Transcript_25787:228-1379(+)|eukprot:CAMPEP_0183704570 /NCGR_PEP_ID=MMETSP0737-20130205/1860_1 /TAXON_ID=385413 /ORGANISM="Thalassiosira miniscula, Strain CCMP1093" /LENGTH=383 /DNA_ID=CAMNT_0025931465 /DNA_START=176 /DNA_END=1327 /DNA_ORIENTATION=+
MSPPCGSNDNFHYGYTNESNDSFSLGLSNLRGVGVGCDEVAAEFEANSKTSAEDPAEATSEVPIEVPTEVTPIEETTTEEATTEELEQEPSFLSCNSSDAEELAEKAGIERIDLQYDYEMRITEEADLSSSLNAFEHGLLKAVADDFGLSSCELVRRSLRKGRKLVGTSSVVGVGSYPGDEEDEIHTECEMDTDSIDATKCIPMNGYMTAWVSKTDDRRLAQSNIYAVIENYSKNYSANGVLGISYIGTRPDVPPPFIDKATKDDGNRDDLASNPTKMSPGAIAGIVIGSLIVLIAILALIARMKKRRDRKEAEVREKTVVDQALFMIDEDDYYDEDMKEGKDDESECSITTEEHTHDDTIPSCNTFESEGEPSGEGGIEVKM